MTQDQFFEILDIVKHNYRWNLDGNTFIGFARNGRRGEAFNVVTAVCRSLRKGNFGNSLEGTTKAAARIGLSPMVAVRFLSNENRGHSQILRGKTRNVLEEA